MGMGNGSRYGLISLLCILQIFGVLTVLMGDLDDLACGVGDSVLAVDLRSVWKGYTMESLHCRTHNRLQSRIVLLL